MFKQAVTTVAVGRPYYLNLAHNLLSSFLLWNPEPNIQFVLLTDNPTFFKEFESNNRVHCIQLDLEESEKSFTSKFLLFDHIIAEQNLFIDCDCLVYGNLAGVFKKFEAYDFSAIGNEITTGEFFCDVELMIKKFNLSSLPWFVGSIYYFKNSAITKQIVAKANELKKKYDELGFVRLRDEENEEPLLAVAMALNHQQTIKDDGSVKADLMFFDSYKSNVLTGKTQLTPKNTALNNTNILPDVSPLIIHFNSSFSETDQYLSEEYRLRNYSSHHRMVLELKILFKYTLKSFLVKNTKNALRPLFHKLVGPMKIRKNKRAN